MIKNALVPGPPDGTVKTLRLYRHSIKDGENISPEGMGMARQLGVQVNGEGLFTISHLFGGPLSRCWQTATAFVGGYAEYGLQASIATHPPMLGLGDEGMFKEIVNDEFREMVKGGASNLDALLSVHLDRRDCLIEGAMSAVEEMFSLMVEEGEVHAAGFFHSPFIELVAFHVLGTLHKGFNRLSELDGIQLYRDFGGNTVIGPKLTFSVNPLD